MIGFTRLFGRHLQDAPTKSNAGQQAPEPSEGPWPQPAATKPPAQDELMGESPGDARPWPESPKTAASTPSGPPALSIAAVGTSGFRPEVVVADGVYHFQTTPNRMVPFLQHGEPLRNLGQGWNFHSLYIEFAPILLFELQHDSGHRATWFFDSTPKFLGHTVEGIPQPHYSTLIRKATALFQSILSPLLRRGSPSCENDVAAFFGISEIARLQLAQACSAIIPQPHPVLLTELPETLLVLPNSAGGPAALISREAVAAAATENFQARLLVALSDGFLSWRSIVDGTYLPVSGFFCFHHFAYAYRIEEPISGCVYFILASEHNARFLGFYIPLEGLIITADPQSQEVAINTFPNLPLSIMNYICQFGDTFIPSVLRTGRKAVAASMRESHLGHQLWNELSGLEAIVHEKPASDLPEVTSFLGRANGCFGPLEKLFPELESKIRHELQSEREIIEYAHRHDLVLARFTRLFVSAKLRTRIIRHMEQTNDFQAALSIRRSIPGPVVILGLRVENRTVVGLEHFLVELIEHIAQVAPGTIIILDGQNRRDDAKPVGSFADNLATRSPLDVEADICRTVIAATAHAPVHVGTTTGQTIASSLAWITEAECFISIWGAGLAKYRWIGNKPGLILSSNYHLLNPAEMSIYHTTTTMETPTTVVYADPSCVQDDPGASQLIPVAGPRYFSFRVDNGLFFPQVTAFLTEFLHVGGQM